MVLFSDECLFKAPGGDGHYRLVFYKRSVLRSFLQNFAKILPLAIHARQAVRGYDQPSAE